MVERVRHYTPNSGQNYAPYSYEKRAVDESDYDDEILSNEESLVELTFPHASPKNLDNKKHGKNDINESEL